MGLATMVEAGVTTARFVDGGISKALGKLPESAGTDFSPTTVDGRLHVLGRHAERAVQVLLAVPFGEPPALVVRAGDSDVVQSRLSLRELSCGVGEPCAVITSGVRVRGDVGWRGVVSTDADSAASNLTSPKSSKVTCSLGP